MIWSELNQAAPGRSVIPILAVQNRTSTYVRDDDISDCMSRAKLKCKTLQKWCGVANVIAIKMEICINCTLQIEYIALKI